LITGPEFGLLRIWDLKTLNLLFLVDCFTKQNYVSASTIITVNNEKSPIIYKVYMPGTTPPNFEDKPTLEQISSEQQKLATANFETIMIAPPK